MIQLNVPLIRQAKMSSDCGPAALAMLLEYHGVGYDFEEMKKGLGVYPWGTVTPQLGTYLLRHGFDVEIITMHPSLFSIHSQFQDADSLKRYLKSLEGSMKGEFDPIALTHFIEFVECGGRISPRVPTLHDIQDEIESGRPVLAPITHWFLHETASLPRFTIHFNIVSGVDNESIFVNDPDWGDTLGGKHQISRENFLYALYASAKGGIDDACILKAQKQ
ncbi:hypothetical protein KBB27_02945 [Patescibacteria group bacterium]|nr:hypothetical protein [Patescibacteria group bacterium]